MPRIARCTVSLLLVLVAVALPAAPPLIAPANAAAGTTLAYARLQPRAGRLVLPWSQYPLRSALVSPIETPDGAGVSLKTTATSPGPNASSVMSAVYVNPPLARAGWHTNHSRRLESTWYHVDMMLPAQSYRPTTGTWNWLVEWHDDPHTAPSSSGPYSIALGIYTDYPVVAGKVGVDPKLVLRMAGGSARNPTYQGLVSPIRVRYDHWYNLTFHFVWSDSAKTGAVQWFVDGRLTASEHFPTLYANQDGTVSYNSFGVYNYHLKCPWPSTVAFGGIAIGPTRMSVRR